MPDKTLNIGVAGCGQIARRLHIPGYADHPLAELKAFYNHRLDTMADLRKRYPEATFSTDYEAFLEQSGIEALSVCTPNALHASMSIAALKRGIHVLVEKPMAVTAKDARSMIEAAAQGKTELMVAQSQRYTPAHIKAREILRSGRLGRIYQIRTGFGHGGPQGWSPRGKWFTSAELSGLGVIGDLGIHKVDLVRFLTGQEFVSVTALQEHYTLDEVADNAAALLRLSEGAMVTLTASWTTRGRELNDMVVFGEEGSLYVGAEPGSPLVLYDRSRKRVVYDVPEGIPSRGETWLLEEIPQFLETVVGQRRNPIPGQEGLRALEVCEAMVRSARTGRTISLT